MADRDPITRTTRARGTPIIIGDRRGEGVGTLPPEGDGIRRGVQMVRMTSSGRREFSYNGSNAALPIIVGGPLKVGAFLIYEKIAGGALYHHWAVCEGLLKAIGAFTNIKFSGQTAASIGAGTESHIGAVGDNTSSLIGFVDGTYTFPDGTAGVVVKHVWPGPTTPRYNPYEFTVDAIGWRAVDFTGAADSDTTNPVRQAAQLLISRGFNKNTDFITAEWLAGQQACDFDIDPGAGVTKRWEISLRLDSQGFLEDQVNLILQHAHAHLRRDGEKYGLWMDLPRSVAQVGGTDLIFTDKGAAANLATKPTVVWRSRSEIPTVTSGTYTDVANGYVDASVQVPDAGPSGEWIEKQYDIRGITTRERARRWVTQAHNINQSELDITMEAWFDGALPLEGDRVRVDSFRLVPSGQTIPNVSGAAAGEEHLVVEEQTWQESSVLLRCSQYRDNQFSDTIDTSGGPTPPSTTPNTPAAPTSLVLATVIDWSNGGDSPVVRIRIDWTPANEPTSSFTRIMYSRDGVNFFELGTGFQSGPAFLESVILGVTHTFNLYTVRTSTGQVSSALTGTITPTAIDSAITEVWKGLITPSGYFQAMPPPGGVGFARSGPTTAPTVTLGAGGIVPTGTYGVTYGWVRQGGLSPLAPRTSKLVTAGSQILQVSGLDAAPADVLYTIVFITDTDTNPFLAPIYDATEMAPASLSSNFNSIVAWVTAENRMSDQYDYLGNIVLRDNFGSPTDPLGGSSAPIFLVIPVATPPHRYHMADVRGHVHADPTTGLPRIDLLVQVQNTQGLFSVGKTYSQTSAAWPVPDMTLAALPAYDGQTLTLVNGNNNNVALNGKHRQVIAGPTGAFTTTGFAGGTAGQRITVVNGVAQTWTVAHNSASSSSGNKIRCAGAANKVYANQYAAVDFEFHTDGFWYLIDT